MYHDAFYPVESGYGPNRSLFACPVRLTLAQIGAHEFFGGNRMSDSGDHLVTNENAAQSSWEGPQIVLTAKELNPPQEAHFGVHW